MTQGFDREADSRASHRMRRLGGLRLGVLLTIALAAYAGTALAAEDEWKNGIPPGSVAPNLPNNGDPGGIRKWLSERGLTYSFIYTGEVLGNVSGGLRRGTIYQGRLEGQVYADLDKILGFKGLNFFANAFQLHGTGGIRRDLTGSFTTISSIEALPTTRLSELWLEQKLLNDTFSIRFGQLIADSDFFISDTSTPFMNSGWPSLFALNLPSGGPSFPFASPGIRLKYEPTNQVTLLAAIYNGDPAGPGPDEPEIKNRHGVNFRVQDPPLLMGEAQYKYNQDKNASGLAGTIKLGFWHHFGEFDHRRFDADGRSLAHPLGSGIAGRLRSSSAIYGVIDQQIYRPAGGGPDSGVVVFSRVAASAPDRNPAEFYLDSGIVFSGILPRRPDDKFGAAVIYTKISRHAADLDRDTNFFTGMPQPIRDYEMTVSLAYQAQIMPGWTVQPEFQYIIHPSGNVADPNAAVPGTPIKNAAVFALRSTIKY
jgi:porin